MHNYTYLKELRIQHKYTSNEVSELLDINRTSYYRIENGISNLKSKHIFTLKEIYQNIDLNILFS